MAKRNYVTGMDCKRLLDEAVEKRLFVKITDKDESRWEMYRSSFLGTQGNRLVLTQPTPEDEQAPIELAEGQNIAVSFKKGYNKCLFVTRVVGHGLHEVEPGVKMPTITVLRPDCVEKMRRRAFNRVDAPSSLQIAVTLRPTATMQGHTECSGLLKNLSAGGMTIEMTAAETEDLQENQQFVLEFVPLMDQGSLQAPARLRHVTGLPDSDQALVGFQFVGLEASAEGRNTLRRLGRIVSVFQRQQPVAKHSNLARRR